MNKLSTFLIGIIGGAIGAVIIFSFENLDIDILKSLLDWPFLGFLLIILIMTIFYKPIQELFKRGKIKLKYGDVEISLEQIVDYIDQNIDTKLESANPDQTELKSVNRIETLEKIQKIFDIKSENLALIIFHLGESKYRWRNLETLTKRTGLSESLVEQIILVYPNLIVRSIGKSGNTIYRLNDQTKLIYNEKLKQQ